MAKLSQIVRESDEMCGIVQRHIEQGSFTTIQSYLGSLTRIELEVLAASLLVTVYELANMSCIEVTS